MKSYTLKEHKDSGELHLFEGDMLPNDPEYKCNSDSKSICKKMNTEDNKGNRFACATAQEAREKTAQIGRKVCGTCVSHLYESY
ncbi:hypothetical protein BFG07_00085 [Kosakonia cowanii]|uniref:hypothetical protein n=1 Tax=Kosakonia cowanii TaxID=208223 RepID=UPI000B97B576|nr:hypothetical protein [Kosakonia cowanii]AST67243.1 hypothetical protein BFG07_00085 [Kosakonia cowanii]